MSGNRSREGTCFTSLMWYFLHYDRWTALRLSVGNLSDGLPDRGGLKLAGQEWLWSERQATPLKVNSLLCECCLYQPWGLLLVRPFLLLRLHSSCLSTTRGGPNLAASAGRNGSGSALRFVRLLNLRGKNTGHSRLLNLALNACPMPMALRPMKVSREG